MGSLLTVVSSLNTTANVGFLTALIVSIYAPNMFWTLSFSLGAIFEIIVNSLVYTENDGNLWERLLGWYTVPLEYNLIITPILLILLWWRQVINVYELSLIVVIYVVAIKAGFHHETLA